MLDSPPRCSRIRLLALLLVGGVAPALAGPGDDFTFGGSLALTSEYLYRGLSQSDGHGAAQADLHVANSSGTFVGVWTSTRAHSLYPGAGYELEAYLGQRLDLGAAWSTSLTGRSHYFPGSAVAGTADYQEISAALSYLDQWTLSVTAIPNAVRYESYDGNYVRVGRHPAWVAETSGQWLLYGGLFATGGVGYYYAGSASAAPLAESYVYAGPMLAPGAGTSWAAPAPRLADGYGYGNVGLAVEHGRWRLDLGYFLVQTRTQQLSAYPLERERVAGTVAWRF